MAKDEKKLKKFLASGDPELVRMGIAMAKAVDVKVAVGDLQHFLKSDDVKTVETGVMLAEEAGIGDEAGRFLYFECSVAVIDDSLQNIHTTRKRAAEVLEMLKKKGY